MLTENTKIEWTDATWNPITGLKHHPSRVGLTKRNADGVSKFTGEVRFNERWLTQPLKWRKPRMIFVCAHGDLFHENVPDEWIDRVFAVMVLCPQHTFQVLTKRPERARAYLEDLRHELSLLRDSADDIAPGLWESADKTDWVYNCDCYEPKFPFKNIWLGTSVSDQDSANKRIGPLMEAPAIIRPL